MRTYNYTLKLTSALSSVTLPFNVQGTKLRVKTLRYVTASASQEMMLIKIQSWTEGNYYFDGTNLQSYTKSVPLPSTASSLVLYENNNNTDSWDVVLSAQSGYMNSFQVEILIDNAYSTDITSGNPVYIELVLE